MRISTYFLILCLFLSGILSGQDTSAIRVEPPHWWSGFSNPKLQLLVHAKAIGKMRPVIAHEGIELVNYHQAKSPNYLFLDLHIDSSVTSTSFAINFEENGRIQYTTPYAIKPRNKNIDIKGFDTSDAIYLITPDRFANGDPANDQFESMRETTLQRKDHYGRHGGDIRGIIDHLDYIANMGFTAIWSTPLLTNDMPKQSYHGYAITDYYAVDPRFGDLDTYKEFAQKARSKGIKIIMDQVANHCGVHHWWMEDLPFEDWVNQQDRFENKQELRSSNHRRTTNQDPYASQYDKKAMTEGWFVAEMPDLNQRNPFMANYIIQNSLWWIETLHLSGIRQDTYPYPDKTFMAEWAKSIMTEYPDFSIVGEEWSYNPLLVGYWQDGNKNKDGYRSHLTHTMDFPIQEALRKGIIHEEAWDTGLIEIYEAIANDFGYAAPENIVAFLDNHDMDRAYTQYKEQAVQLKMALGVLLLLPRVPQIYYGTEVLIENSAQPGDHGLIRTDFPGGWVTDSINGFTQEGLNTEQIDMQKFIQKMLHYRKQSTAIQQGQLIHFAPFDGIYTLVRSDENETVVLFLNKNSSPYAVDLERFRELQLDGKKMINVLTEEEVEWSTELIIPKKGVYFYRTKN